MSEQIKETDIMIGNRVNLTVEGKDGVFNQNIVIEEIRKDVILFNNGIHAAYRMLRPIPLTEDILLKCGSVFHDEECHIPCLYGDIVIEKYENLWFFTAGEGCKLSQGFYSVHQLQNLIKAITQTDLKVEV